MSRCPAKIIRNDVVVLWAMMNELLKIQQDMAAPQRQQQQRQQKSPGDDDDAGNWADPNDWLADLPKFDVYHRGYTTNHWLQVFRAL
jgi:hypothetical protein